MSLSKDNRVQKRVDVSTRLTVIVTSWLTSLLFPPFFFLIFFLLPFSSSHQPGATVMTQMTTAFSVMLQSANVLLSSSTLAENTRRT
jgi:hypothetical protein